MAIKQTKVIKDTVKYQGEVWTLNNLIAASLKRLGCKKVRFNNDDDWDGQSLEVWVAFNYEQTRYIIVFGYDKYALCKIFNLGYGKTLSVQAIPWVEEGDPYIGIDDKGPVEGEPFGEEEGWSDDEQKYLKFELKLVP